MGKRSRAKGGRGEREVFGLLSDLLGTIVKRNINARRGDCDSLELDGWACESKRTERWLEEYWTQACEQAERVKRKPVLFHRANREAWAAYVDLADVMPGIRRGHRVRMTLEAFADLVREMQSTVRFKVETTYGVDPLAGTVPGALVVHPLGAR